MQFLLTLLIFVLPFGVLTRINIYENVYIYLQDVIVGIMSVLLIYEITREKIKIEQKSIFLPLIGFILIGLLSLIFNSQYLNFQTFFISALYLVRFFAYSSLIYIAMSIKDKTKLIDKLIISGLIFTCLGFIQYFFYSNLRNLYYAGWDEHLYRLFSTALDPNFAGIFLALAFLLTLYKLLSRSNFKIKKEMIILLGISAIEIIAIYLTYSRSALIALIVGVISLLVMINKKILLIPIFIVMIFGLITFSNTKIEGMNPLRTASSIARIDTAKEAFGIFVDNPIIGVGFDAFRYAQIRYGVRNENISIPSNADAGTDNSYLFILVTTGVIGLSLYLKFIFEYIKEGFNIWKKSKTTNYVIAISSLFALLAGSIFINALFYPLIMAWIFILMGSVIQNKKQ